jgi:hypothetical protein
VPDWKNFRPTIPKIKQGYLIFKYPCNYQTPYAAAARSIAAVRSAFTALSALVLITKKMSLQ